MLKVCSIEKSFARKPVLCGIDFELSPGEMVGLVGPSGGGKSVLLKILGSVLKPDSGSVSATSDSVGFLFQEGALFDSMSVLENTAYPLTVTPTLGRSRTALANREEAQERSLKILEEVGLSKAVEKLPGQLSGGMRRRAALARALVSNPELVLLDDPTGGLDPVAATVIIDLIKELHSRYKPTVVMVSHDIRRLLPNVERVLALFEGKITANLPPKMLESDADPTVVEFLRTRFDFESFNA